MLTQLVRGKEMPQAKLPASHPGHHTLMPIKIPNTFPFSALLALRKAGILAK